MMILNVDMEVDLLVTVPLESATCGYEVGEMRHLATYINMSRRRDCHVIVVHTCRNTNDNIMH